MAINTQLLSAGLLTGSGEGDTLIGSFGDDTLSGGAGDDIVAGDAGSDVLFGDGGNDALYGYQIHDDYYSAPLTDEGTDTVFGGGGNDRILLSGNMVADGGDGDDFINQYSGNLIQSWSENFTRSEVIANWSTAYWDLLHPAPSVDRPSVSGGGGSDQIFVDRAASIDAGSGDDYVIANSDNTGASVGTYEGGSGHDRLVLSVAEGEPSYSDEYGDFVNYKTDFSKLHGFEELLLTRESAWGVASATRLTLPDSFLAAGGVMAVGVYARNGAGQAFYLDASAEKDGSYVFEHGMFIGDGAISAAYRLIIKGGQRGDTINGWLLDDVLQGNGGADSIVGGDGNDTLRGGTGDDSLDGGNGSDVLQGGLGSDSLSGGPGTDTLVGGAGNDTYVVDGASDLITESTNEGTDLVRASVSYTLADNVENLTLSAGPSSSGTGNALANRISGNSRANTLDGSAGADTLIGGAGNDSYNVDSTNDIVTENAGAGADTVWASLNHTLAANVENLRLTGSAVSGTGNSSDNAMSGTDAANTLSGAAGNDTLDGGAGSDTLVGGTGNDTYVVDVINDVVTEAAAAGLDLVQSSLDWTLSLNVEQLLLLDGAVSGTGNTQNNTLMGNALSNVLSGLEGNDTLVGAGAPDTLIGGLGNDTYLANLGDQLIEAAGQGNDTVKSNIAWTLGAELENLSLGGPGNIGGTGNDLGNLIRGNDGNNRLQGLGGADTLIGGLGADLLEGGLQNDNLTGGVGADRLVGGDGNDALIGGADKDTLTGGKGIDAFVFESALSAATNLDTVVDFAAGVDKLRLDDDVFAAFTVGVALTASQFVSGAGITAAQTTDQRIAYNTTTGALYYDADGLNGAAAVQFAVLGSSTHPALSAGDFVIVA